MRPVRALQHGANTHFVPALQAEISSQFPFNPGRRSFHSLQPGLSHNGPSALRRIALFCGFDRPSAPYPQYLPILMPAPRNFPLPTPTFVKIDKISILPFVQKQKNPTSIIPNKIRHVAGGARLSPIEALTSVSKICEKIVRSICFESVDRTHEDRLNLETSTSRGFEKHTFDVFDRQRRAS